MCGRVVFGGLFFDFVSIVSVKPKKSLTAENAEFAKNSISQILGDLGMLGG